MRIAWMVTCCCLVTAVGAVASTETARGILDRRKDLDDTTRHWDNREQHVTLAVQKKGGAAQRLRLTLYERRLPDREERAVLFFEEPASQKGVAFLSFSHPGRADEQWIYLPALKRVRQIGFSKSARKDSFVGTDLSYHDLDVLQDMTSWSEAEAPATLLGEETIDGVATYRIELEPTRDDVYYTRILLWLGKDDLVARRAEFFDGGREPVKRIVQSDVRTVDRIPLAHHLDVETVGAGSHTSMDIDGVRFNQQLEADLFTQRSLERGRR
jgi:outer membrane lipoprotein-sorting protein